MKGEWIEVFTQSSKKERIVGIRLGGKPVEFRAVLDVQRRVFGIAVDVSYVQLGRRDCGLNIKFRILALNIDLLLRVNYAADQKR